MGVASIGRQSPGPAACRTWEAEHELAVVRVPGALPQSRGRIGDTAREREGAA